MQHTNGYWDIAKTVLAVAAAVFVAWLRLSSLISGVAGVISPAPEDATPAPPSPGRTVWRVFCGIVGLCCIAMAGVMLWGTVVIATGDEARPAAIFTLIAAAGLLFLARACQRIGRESFRWR